jgi:DNA-directed RNA polymerase specialized sigma24 family protein
MNDMSDAWPANFDTAFKKYAPVFGALISRLAAQLGLGNQREELIQDFWLHVWRKWDQVIDARFPYYFMRTIAVRIVLNACYRCKVRVHLSFVPDVDARVVLNDLGLECALKPIRKVGPTGLPLYSGRVWPSQVEHLNSHRDVAFVQVWGIMGFVMIEGKAIGDGNRSARSAKGRACLRDCAERIRPKLSDQEARILDLCDFDGVSEEEVARQLCLQPSVVRRYRNNAWRVLRENCPWLKELLGPEP